MTNPTQPAERWQLVPVRPTQEMLNAAESAFETDAFGGRAAWPSDIYRAMVEAAPKAPPMPDKVRRAIKELRKGAGSNILINEISVLLGWLEAQGFTKE